MPMAPAFHSISAPAGARARFAPRCVLRSAFFVNSFRVPFAADCIRSAWPQSRLQVRVHDEQKAHSMSAVAMRPGGR
jgi:hypothetical protein